MTSTRTIVSSLIARLGAPGLNFLLRLASLVGKFGLTIYLAQYLSLDDLGLYGLVFSVVAFAVVVYGARLDYDLSRLIVSRAKVEAHVLLRDQSVFFLLNYAASIPLILASKSLFPGSVSLLALTSLICWLESYANFLFVNTNALGQSNRANIAFFVRSGLWTIVVIACGLAFPFLRSLWFVLLLWAIGTGSSIVLNLWFLGAAQWPSIRSVGIDWSPIRSALVRGLPMWLGSIGLVGGSYIDRFILGAYLDLNAVGLATFYTSFSTAVVTLVTSSMTVIAVPGLIKAAQKKEFSRYNRELRNTNLRVILVGGVLSLGISIAVPYLGNIIRKPGISENVVSLWLLMAAALVRLVAETAFYGLYSRHGDRTIWVGNMIFLFASILLNLVLVRFFGLTGLGLSSVLASLILLSFRYKGLLSLRG